ncbi:MAG: hypothetical protein B6I36_08825 [Desulfobacteraceae bacterium 4572_35.1]|nr:MAG: hypothetical protein B6I36_08825 [Desulfobacteraceae bacterium 4572_35.1]
MKKIILTILIILLIAAGITLLKKRQHSIASAPVAVPINYTVETITPKTMTVTQTKTFLAKLEAQNSAALSSKFSGKIGKLLVHENQKVQVGQLLVHIDSQEISSNIAALQAKLKAARKQRDYNKSQHERNTILFKAGGLSQEVLEASEVTLCSATAAIKELKQNIKGFKNQLNYCDIRAPFNGIIGTIYLRQGDLATPGKTIISVNSQPQKLTFSFMAEAAHITAGQTVLVQKEQVGKITRIYADAKNSLSVAEIKPDKPFHQPCGSYITIEVVTKTATGCAVPIQTLLHRKQGTTIMVQQKKHFEEKAVQVVVTGKEFILISPCVSSPVAVASEAKLSLLPSYGNVRVLAGDQHE